MTTANANAPIGAVLDQKFRVTREIGRGGMAAVYAAENVDIGKPVAVKILAAEYATSRTVTERFLREARAAARIKSPYICEVYDVGTYEGRPFIVMELLNGESLYEKLARERRLKIEEALRVATHVAKGLKKAHDLDVVHRDLKPENIFLTIGEDGTPLSKVVDFGLAKFYEPHLSSSNARLTKEGALFGTPAYMSPEQAKAKGNVDGRSDLWALGCIVYEMLTGRTVWDVEQGVAMILAQIASSNLPDPRKYRPDLPPAFTTWFGKALARKVDQRFADADEFVAELDQALAPVVGGSPEAASPALASSPVASAQLAEAPGQLEQGSPAAPANEAVSIKGEQAAEVAVSEPQKGRVGGLLMAVLLGAAVLGLGIWFAQRGAAGGRSPPAETAQDAKLINEAQRLLFEDEPQRALAKFQQAFDTGQGKAARSLLTHSSVALDADSGSCRLRGIGHPRPFDAKTPGSKPSILETGEALLVTWADSEVSADKIQSRVAHLDAALRRVSGPINVTPETEHAREPELFLFGETLGLLYWDFEGEGAGPYVRQLDAHGNIAGPPRLLGTQQAGHPYYPAVAPDAQGNVWAVWVEPTRPRVHDLYVRKLSPVLKPLTKPTAITGYASPRRGKAQAARPSLQVVGDMLFVTYTLRRPTSQEVLLLRVPVQAAEAAQSVVPAQNAEQQGDEESDRFLGQAKQLSSGAGKHGRSTLRCGPPGCFATWDQVPGGAHVAFLNADGSLQWRRLISRNGSRPSMGLGSEGGLLSWYDNRQKRVKIAPFTPEALGDASVVGRISAVMNHPQPLVMPVRPGILGAGMDVGWYIAWRGYEAAVQEPFLARAGCQ